MKTILLFFLFNSFAYAEGSSYSFLITFFPGKVQVISPHEVRKNVSVIIKNNSLNNIWGKLTDEDNKELEFVGIPSQGSKAIHLKNFNKDKNYYFVSQSPPFQNIVLTFNKSTYEIPPSR